MASQVLNQSELTVRRGGQAAPKPAPEETCDSASARANGSGRVSASASIRAASLQRSGRIPNPAATPPPVGNLAPMIPGYAVKGEIARRGMGIVLAARDI